jgi:CheY-specific phosphatase CheX
VIETVLHQALRHSVDEVLEKMFFAETLGEAPDASPEAADDIAVELAFEGEAPGVMYLRLTATAAREIAADFLGIEAAEISGTRVSEVVRELANMICGSVLSRVESAVVFRLGVPRIAASPGELPEASWHTPYCVQLSNGRITVDIVTGTNPCP